MSRAQLATRWLAVLVGAALVLAPLVHSGFFVVTFDDDAFVIDNPLIRTLSWTSWRSWFGSFYHADYVPLALASLAVDHKLWGLWPGGYHLTSIALHLGASTLVAVFIGAMSRQAAIGLVAGALFAVHPMQLETVAIISQRKTLLATFSALLALLAYERHRRRPSKLAYACALGCFGIGGLAKSSIVTLPLLLFLCDWRCGRRPGSGGKLPFFALAAVLAWLSLASKMGIGVIKPAHGGSATATALLMGRVWVEYALAFLFPFGLSPAYYYRPSMAHSPWHVAALLVAVSGHVVLWRQRRRWPTAAFALFWFTLAMLPVANIIPIAVVRADRYVYLAMVGPVWWAAAVLKTASTRATGLPRPLRYALTYLLLLLLTVLTLRGTRVWRNDVTIWSRAVAVHPWNARAHYFLGRAYRNAGFTPAAIQVLQRAAELDPTFAAPRRLLALLRRRDELQNGYRGGRQGTRVPAPAARPPRRLDLQARGTPHG